VRVTASVPYTYPVLLTFAYVVWIRAADERDLEEWWGRPSAIELVKVGLLLLTFAVIGLITFSIVAVFVSMKVAAWVVAHLFPSALVKPLANLFSTEAIAHCLGWSGIVGFVYWAQRFGHPRPLERRRWLRVLWK
jgi:hypothetical protein